MSPSNGHVATQQHNRTTDSAMAYEDYDASFINMKLNEPSWMKTFEVAKQQQSQQQNGGTPSLTTHLESDGGGGGGGRPKPRRSNSFSDSRSSFQMSMGPAWMKNFKLDKPKALLDDVSFSDDDDDSDDDDFDNNEPDWMNKFKIKPLSKERRMNSLPPPSSQPHRITRSRSNDDTLMLMSPKRHTPAATLEVKPIPAPIVAAPLPPRQPQKQISLPPSTYSAQQQHYQQQQPPPPRQAHHIHQMNVQAQAQYQAQQPIPQSQYQPQPVSQQQYQQPPIPQPQYQPQPSAAPTQQYQPQPVPEPSVQQPQPPPQQEQQEQTSAAAATAKSSRFDPEKLKQKFSKPNKLSEKFSILQEDQAKVADESSKSKPMSDKFKHLEKKPSYGGSSVHSNESSTANGSTEPANEDNKNEAYSNQVEIDTSAPTVNTNIWGKKLKPKRDDKNLTLLSWRQICEKQDKIAAKLAKYKSEGAGGTGSGDGGSSKSDAKKKKEKEKEEDDHSEKDSDKNDSDDDDDEDNSNGCDSESSGGGGDDDDGEMDEAALAALFGRTI